MHDGELKYYKDMAYHVKQRLEDQYEKMLQETKDKGKDNGLTWHVVVGTHFGSFIGYEAKSVNLFWLEHIGFLVWRHA